MKEAPAVACCSQGVVPALMVAALVVALAAAAVAAAAAEPVVAMVQIKKEPVDCHSQGLGPMLVLAPALVLVLVLSPDGRPAFVSC